MTRRGSALIVLLAVFALAVVVAAGSAVDRVRRQRALHERAQRIAARELALGAASLDDGQQITIGGWTVRREGSGASVSGPAGTLTSTPTGDRWQARGRR